MKRLNPGVMTTSTSNIAANAGVLGVFFDDLRADSKEVCFAFVEDCASHFWMHISL